MLVKEILLTQINGLHIIFKIEKIQDIVITLSIIIEEFLVPPVELKVYGMK